MQALSLLFTRRASSGAPPTTATTTPPITHHFSSAQLGQIAKIMGINVELLTNLTDKQILDKLSFACENNEFLAKAVVELDSFDFHFQPDETVELARNIRVKNGAIHSGRLEVYQGDVTAVGSYGVYSAVTDDPPRAVACSRHATVRSESGGRAIAAAKGAQAIAGENSTAWAVCDGAIAMAEASFSQAYAEAAGATAMTKGECARACATIAGAKAYATGLNSMAIAEKGGEAWAHSKKTWADATGLGSKAYADASGSIARADKGAHAFALKPGSQAKARSPGSCAFATYAYAEAIASVKGTKAYAVHPLSTSKGERGGEAFSGKPTDLPETSPSVAGGTASSESASVRTKRREGKMHDGPPVRESARAAKDQSKAMSAPSPKVTLSTVQTTSTTRGDVGMVWNTFGVSGGSRAAQATPATSVPERTGRTVYAAERVVPPVPPGGEAQESRVSRHIPDEDL